MDPDDRNRGVLIDLDLAVRVQGSDKKPIGEPQPPGTITFRSVDLCKDNPQEVFYRHDLESFFFVLAWIFTHYDKGKPVLRDQYRHWHEGDLKSIAGSKMGFLIMASLRLTSPPRLQTSWIVRLAEMFDTAYRSRSGFQTRQRRTSIPESFDEETLEGQITYEKFMDILEAPDLPYLEAPDSE